MAISTEQLSFQNFDKLPSYNRLKRAARVDVKAVMTGKAGADRVCRYAAAMPCSYTFNYACRPVDDAVLAVLKKLAGEAQLIEKYRALASGAVINTGEKRSVLHHLLRGQVADDVVVDGVNKKEFYQNELAKIRAFASQVRTGRITAPDGRPFTDVVQIGIGGSDLGPRALYIALENWAKAEGIPVLTAHFVSNVDPDDPAAVLNAVDLAHTLFIIVSKSGTTLETLTNEIFAGTKLEAAGLDPKKQVVVCTSETSKMAAEAKEGKYLEAFFMDDYIGGRYSSSSCVGGVVLSLAYGPHVFESFLAGAHAADVAAMEPDPLKNAAMLDALIGVYERTVLGYPVTAVLPYSQALLRFPAHLQQLDMESNGKSVNRDAQPVDYVTGPVIFGEPGTNGQHSFYQLLHQGKTIVTLQFIGYRESQLGDDVTVKDTTSQEKLKANLAAQIIAFATGKSDENPNKNFEGGRPSSLIAGDRLTPETLGALLAHFENKVMFQGFLWNVNSFDQEGVQLGKKLATKVLARDFAEGDEPLVEYCKVLGLKTEK